MGLDLRGLFGIVPAPDGAAPVLEAEALARGAAASAALLPGSAAAPPSSAAVLQAVLAQKLLDGWIRNRYQTRYPLTLNLRNEDPADAATILATVRAGMEATAADAEAWDRARAFVAGVGGVLGREAGPAALPANTVPLGLRAQAYAATAGALGRRGPTTRRYLEFLAPRLGLSDDVARSLNRRFAS